MPRIRYRYNDSELYYEGFLERNYVTKADVLAFLERDQADLSSVRGIRYRVSDSDAFVLLSDDAFVRVDDTVTILLVKGTFVPGCCVDLCQALKVRLLLIGSAPTAAPSAATPSQSQAPSFAPGENPQSTPGRSNVTFGPTKQTYMFSPSQQPSAAPVALSHASARSPEPASLSASLPVHARSAGPLAPRDLLSGSGMSSAGVPPTMSASGASISLVPPPRSPAAPVIETEGMSEERWLRLFLTGADLNHFQLTEDHHLGMRV
jgi:hypothetical protein